MIFCFFLLSLVITNHPNFFSNNTYSLSQSIWSNNSFLGLIHHLYLKIDFLMDFQTQTKIDIFWQKVKFEILQKKWRDNVLLSSNGLIFKFWCVVVIIFKFQFFRFFPKIQKNGVFLSRMEKSWFFQFFSAMKTN